MISKAKDICKFMDDRQYEVCIEVLRRLNKVGILENIINDLALFDPRIRN